MEAIAATLKRVTKDLFGVDLEPELSRPDEQFGDYTTNVAMQLASRLSRKPREIAEDMAQKLRTESEDMLQEVSIAGPGFINMRLHDSHVFAQAHDATQKDQPYRGKVVVSEYSDPNPFKVLHVGHIYTTIVGDVISNLLAAAGGEVHRVNFGGDVGLHVARAMWAIVQRLGGEEPEKLDAIPVAERSEWMAACYVEGTAAYDRSEEDKQDIITTNKRVYRIHIEDDHTSPFARIYWTCRQWSYDYFNAFYDRIGTPFEKYYPESQTAPLGIKTVEEQLAKGVYEKSDGAVIFRGEPYGLHTRVFINSNDLPTYEAKEVGLSMAKWRDYHFDQSVIITGNDIVEYMKVVLKSIEQFKPELAKRTLHQVHGNVKLQGGVKMSSRKGNFLRAVDVLDIATAAARKAGFENKDTVVGAVKYALLKQRLGADIIYSPEESVRIDGNSGPYIQYAHARACSIMRKAKQKPNSNAVETLEPAERSLARKLGEYPEVVAKAVHELMPHYVCVYLYELAQEFNRFYEHNRVVGDARESLRIQLVTDYRAVLKDGLTLLGITAPEQM